MYLFLFKPRSHRLGGFLLCTRFIIFFLVLSGSRPKLPLTANCLHRMMSSSANYRPFLSSFRHFPPPPPPLRRVLSSQRVNCLHTKKWRPKGEMLIWSNLGQNPSTLVLVKNPHVKFILKGQGIFSLDVNKIIRLQVTLNSRYAKNVIRYSFFRIFAEGQESHVSQTNHVF